MVSDTHDEHSNFCYSWLGDLDNKLFFSLCIYHISAISNPVGLLYWLYDGENKGVDVLRNTFLIMKSIIHLVLLKIWDVVNPRYCATHSIQY